MISISKTFPIHSIRNYRVKIVSQYCFNPASCKNHNRSHFASDHSKNSKNSLIKQSFLPQKILASSKNHFIEEPLPAAHEYYALLFIFASV